MLYVFGGFAAKYIQVDCFLPFSPVAGEKAST